MVINEASCISGASFFIHYFDIMYSVIGDYRRMKLENIIIITV